MVPPRSELELQLAKTWAELLDLDQIGVDQDIFALGADSLTVAQMLSRLRARFGVDLSFKDIFDAPTVAALAARIESSERNLLPHHCACANAGGCCSVRLSFQQQRIYVLSRLDPTGYNYHVVEVARAVWAARSRRLGGEHRDDLRAPRGAEVDFPRTAMGEPVQTVGTAVRGSNAWTCDRVPGPGERRPSNGRHENCCANPSILKRSRRCAPSCCGLDEDDHALVIKLHHLVTDGWSQRLFWEELEALYGARLNGAAGRTP